MTTTQQSSKVVSVDVDGYQGHVVAVAGATKAQIEREIDQRYQVTSMELGQEVVASDGVNPALVRYPLTRK